MRSGPHYSEEMGTQATLGTIIKILKIQENGWWYIQSPDGYLSWIFRGAVLPLTGFYTGFWGNTCWSRAKRALPNGCGRGWAFDPGRAAC